MIQSFKHKSLKKYFESESMAGTQNSHARKLKMQLVAIDTAHMIEDVDLPSYQLHLLRGDRESIWSMPVKGNWRVTFEFKDGNASILNYEDYH